MLVIARKQASKVDLLDSSRSIRRLL